jgi:SAM-dependent methyltransferase
MRRKERILNMIRRDGVGLEIGPSFNPVTPKSEGFNVRIVDHLNANELRTKYENARVDLSKIEEVDYVFSGGSLFDLIGTSNRFDYIIACHLIEHTVDLLGFLVDCEKLLMPTGKLILAIPDKRFAFDCLRPVSTTGQVLQAHLNKGRFHSVGNVFDEVAYNCTRNNSIAWGPRQSGRLKFFRPLSDAKAVYEQLLESPSFHDIHAWQFSPSSFRLMIHDLAEIGAMRLREADFSDSIDQEFVVSMSCNSVGCKISRENLAELVISEQHAIRPN